MWGVCVVCVCVWCVCGICVGVVCVWCVVCVVFVWFVCLPNECIMRSVATNISYVYVQYIAALQLCGVYIITVLTFFKCAAIAHSSVGIATGYGLDGPGFGSRWGRDFRTRPDRLWGPPSLL